MKKLQVLGARLAQSKLARGAVAVGSAVAVSGAHAAIDTAAATTGITDATTALLTVVGALTTMAATLFGAYKIYKFLSNGK